MQMLPVQLQELMMQWHLPRFSFWQLPPHNQGRSNLLPARSVMPSEYVRNIKRKRTNMKWRQVIEARGKGSNQYIACQL